MTHRMSPDAQSLLPPPCGDGLLPGLAIGADYAAGEGVALRPLSPIDGAETLPTGSATRGDVRRATAAAAEAFRGWRTVPAPRRGALVYEIGQRVREHKARLAELITLEAGKIVPEAEGEVQEWIDVCDFAVGLSRQLHGLTIASERPEHHLIESWQPLGPVGVISAFNFPCAVWAWNAMLALVCGDTVVWKPSEQAPLTALACHELVAQAAAEFQGAPAALSSVVLGAVEPGKALAADPAVPLVSATGSVAMGRNVASAVGERLGRCLLELGGNNGMIVTPSADLALTERAVLFAATGTCGQRCTSLRRLIVHRTIANELVDRLRSAYRSLPIGDPRETGTLIGPLVNETSFDKMQQVLADARSQGGEVVCGGGRVEAAPGAGFYVEPAIVRMPAQTEVVREETFAPILYVLEYDEIEEAIETHNAVPQGLSSSIFTTDVREAHRFLGPSGSDCGLVGVNVSTSGAEIGAAFGGEKDTGGGRESGSDAWKQYMRRSTATVNYGDGLPLAQGVRFDRD